MPPPVAALVDAGANLTLLKPREVEENLRRAAAAGVTDIIVIGTSVVESRKARDLVADERYTQCGVNLFFTAGVHPLNAGTWQASTPQQLTQLAAHPLCVAIGECGLDSHAPPSGKEGKGTPPMELQRWVFEAQVEIAAEHNLPLYLHERGGEEGARDLISILSRHRSICKRSLLHCFDRPADVLAEYLAQGLRISISGLVGMAVRGAPLRAALACSPPPLSSILVETDAPFLKPDMPDGGVAGGDAGKRHSNEPAFLPVVVDALAAALGQPAEAVARATAQNTREFFGLDAHLERYYSAPLSPGSSAVPQGGAGVVPAGSSLPSTPSGRTSTAAPKSSVGGDPPAGDGDDIYEEEDDDEEDDLDVTLPGAAAAAAAPIPAAASPAPGAHGDENGLPMTRHEAREGGINGGVPPPTSLVLSDLILSHPPDLAQLGGPRFVVPLMLRKLCYCLRGLSFDCMLLRHNNLNDVVETARKEGRIAVVRHDKGVAHQFASGDILKVDSDAVAMQVKLVFTRFDLRPSVADIEQRRRCTTCNHCRWALVPAKDFANMTDNEVVNRFMGTKVQQCMACRKVSWPIAKDYGKVIHEFYALIDAEGRDLDKNAYDVVKAARGQRRSRCGFWNGKVGTCRNGTRCPFLHVNNPTVRAVNADGSKAKDTVCVIPIHARHGLLLMKGQLASGPPWEIPRVQLLGQAETPEDAAAEIVERELGIALPRGARAHRLYRATDKYTSERLDAGRRLYYEVYLNDADSCAAGHRGARPPDSGEAFWLRTARAYCFIKDHALAAKAVKVSGVGTAGKGDVEGATALKRLAHRGAVKGTTSQHAPLTDDGIRTLVRAAAGLPDATAPGVEGDGVPNGGGVDAPPRDPQGAGDGTGNGTARQTKAAAKKQARKAPPPQAFCVFNATRAAETYDDKMCEIVGRLNERGIAAPSFTRVLWEVPKAPMMAGKGRAEAPAVPLEPLPPLAVLNAARDPRVAKLGEQERVLRVLVDDHMGRPHEVAAVANAVRDRVEARLRDVTPGAMVRVFGGAAAGTSGRTGYDVDLCVRWPQPTSSNAPTLNAIGVHGNATPEEREAESAALLEIYHALQSADVFACLTPVLNARVPVLAGRLRCPGSTIPVDITLRPLGIVNTALLTAYYARDPLLRPCSFLVKTWGRWAGVKGTEVGSLSSYALVLLLIYAGIRQGDVELVPVGVYLEGLRSGVLLETSSVVATDGGAGGEGGRGVAAAATANDPVLTQRLARFFRYYGWEHQWDRDVVCIADPWGASRAVLPDTLMAAAPAVLLDPYERHLNLARNLKASHVAEFARRCRLSYAELAGGGLGGMLLE